MQRVREKEKGNIRTKQERERETREQHTSMPKGTGGEGERRNQDGQEGDTHMHMSKGTEKHAGTYQERGRETEQACAQKNIPIKQRVISNEKRESILMVTFSTSFGDLCKVAAIRSRWAPRELVTVSQKLEGIL